MGSLFFFALFFWTASLIVILVSARKSVERIFSLSNGTSKQVNEIFDEFQSNVGKNMAQQGDMDQMATTLEELSMTLSSCAAMAENTATLSSGSEASAIQGEAAVSEVVDAMGKIVEHQFQITETNDQIDRIAYESRIVSLNSLIEAARAKENGVAFMVVAKHLEKLSKKIISSAEKIDHFVNENHGEVSNGEQKASAAFKGLGEITKSCTEAAKGSSKIANALKNQSMGVSELSQTLSTLQHETQVTAYKLEGTLTELRVLLGRYQEIESIMALWSVSEKNRLFTNNFWVNVLTVPRKISDLGLGFITRITKPSKESHAPNDEFHDVDDGSELSEIHTASKETPELVSDMKVELQSTGTDTALRLPDKNDLSKKVEKADTQDDFDEF